MSILTNAIRAASKPDDDKLYVEDVFSAYAYTGTDKSQSIENGITFSDLVVPVNEAVFAEGGVHHWKCPPNVTSVCVVCVGAGGGGYTYGPGGGGGGLGYKNHISVTPGETYLVVVGKSTGQDSTGKPGGDSYFISPSTVLGGGGNKPHAGSPGTFVGDGGGNGGSGSFAGEYGGSGGGAGGYSGNGGNGNMYARGSSGTGGGGGGGGSGGSMTGIGSCGGGGVGIYGEGPSGTGGLYVYPNPSGTDTALGGSGGSKCGPNNVAGGLWDTAGEFGGGGCYMSSPGGGAVRILWGEGRHFPTTDVIEHTEIVKEAVGGLVWTKNRNSTAANVLIDTINGADKVLSAHLTNAIGTSTAAVTKFTGNGYEVGSAPNNYTNQNNYSYISWSFAQAERFFHMAKVTKVAGVDLATDFSVLGAIGAVLVKRIDATGDWAMWHRALDPEYTFWFNSTREANRWNEVTVDGTNVILPGNNLVAGEYMIYAWAHDEDEDGIIQCGEYAGNGTSQVIDLGWEAQWIMVKPIDAVGPFNCWDSARGLSFGGRNSLELKLNNIQAEVKDQTRIEQHARGFGIRANHVWVNGPSNRYAYIAIRRSNKPAKSGADVFNAVVRAGTSKNETITGIGFNPDWIMFRRKSAGHAHVFDRLRGYERYILTASQTLEATMHSAVISMRPDSIEIGGAGAANHQQEVFLYHMFKRTRKVFDMVGYVGDGINRAIQHSLDAVPELIIIKLLDAALPGRVYALTPTSHLELFGESGSSSARVVASDVWNDTAPTKNTFSLGTNAHVNAPASAYIAYLFSSLSGISKVGSYLGTGTFQQINCGFSTGARYVLIKRTDATGDWFMWDAIRGIVAGNDPYVLLNTNDAEITNTDYIDPHPAGFEISSSAPAAINAVGGEYIYLAIA